MELTIYWKMETNRQLQKCGECCEKDGRGSYGIVLAPCGRGLGILIRKE